MYMYMYVCIYIYIYIHTCIYLSATLYIHILVLLLLLLLLLLVRVLGLLFLFLRVALQSPVAVERLRLQVTHCIMLRDDRSQQHIPCCTIQFMACFHLRRLDIYRFPAYFRNRDSRLSMKRIVALLFRRGSGCLAMPVLYTFVRKCSRKEGVVSCFMGLVVIALPPMT